METEDQQRNELKLTVSYIAQL